MGWMGGGPVRMDRSRGLDLGAYPGAQEAGAFPLVWAPHVGSDFKNPSHDLLACQFLLLFLFVRRHDITFSRVARILFLHWNPMDALS